IVERADNRPPVHLALVDLLCAVIEAGRVAQSDRVRRREQAKRRMRSDHPRLVEKGQLSGDLQDALDNEHHVGPACVILVKNESRVRLESPGLDALFELRYLLSIAQDNGITSKEIYLSHVAV